MWSCPLYHTPLPGRLPVINEGVYRPDPQRTELQLPASTEGGGIFIESACVSRALLGDTGEWNVYKHMVCLIFDDKSP